MTDRVLSGFDASTENIADALEALAIDIRNGDADCKGHEEHIDLHTGDPVEWSLAIDFTLTDEARYRDLTDPHALGDDT
jgi:hypothetical protein